MTTIGAHKGGFCHIEAWDLTIINWFLFGMVDGEFDWFEPAEERPHTFEGRIDKFLLPMMEKYSLKAPDLIIEVCLADSFVFPALTYAFRLRCSGTTSSSARYDSMYQKCAVF